jgi:NAD(P)-dependent dehydrogenase (short-subunit alcohol dehydrogenase family)
MELAGQAALITGGSRGLGRALGLALAARGARVVLVARGASALDDSVRELRARGAQAYGIAADVADKHAVHRIAAEATALVGPIDLLVHNASTLGPVPLAPMLDTSCEDFERALAVNVLGAFRLTKALAGAMVLRQRGTIVQVSSDAALEAYPRWGAYGASKAAADHVARTLAVELGAHGVRVITVDPGEMDTAMHRAADPDADATALARPEWVAARIVDILENEGAVPNGERIRTSDWNKKQGAA